MRAGLVARDASTGFRAICFRYKRSKHFLRTRSHVVANPFSFATATEILFGRGQAAIAAERIAVFGSRVLLVHGRNPARSDRLRSDLAARGCAITGYPVASEPDIAVIEAGIDAARSGNAQVVVAL